MTEFLLQPRSDNRKNGMLLSIRELGVCIQRRKPSTHSEVIRAPIPKLSGQEFRRQSGQFRATLRPLPGLLGIGARLRRNTHGAGFLDLRDADPRPIRRRDQIHRAYRQCQEDQLGAQDFVVNAEPVRDSKAPARPFTMRGERDRPKLSVSARPGQGHSVSEADGIGGAPRVKKRTRRAVAAPQ